MEPILEPVMEPVMEPFEDILPEAELEGGFSRRRLAWAVAIAVASFAIFLLLLAYGHDLEGRPVPGPNTFSQSALGYQGAVELLRALGLGVVSRQATAGSGVGPDHPLVLAEPDSGRGGGSARQEILWQEAEGRKAPLVVILPKWSPGKAQKNKPDWLDQVELMPDYQVRSALGPLWTAGHPLEIRRLPRARSCRVAWSPGESAPLSIDTENVVQLLQADEVFEPVIECAGGFLVALRPAKENRPPLVVIADPDLLNNHGLGRGDNAAAVYQIFTRTLKAKGVVFDETIHGFSRTRGLIAEALRFPMVLAVLQGLILLGVVLWAGMGRFGKPLPAAVAGLAAGKAMLIGNTAAMLTGGGHVADSASRYFQQTTRAVAAYYFLPPDLPEAQRLARLQALSEGHGKRLNLIALESDLQRLPEGRRGQDQAAWIAQRLYQWRVEMTNVDRKSA